MTKPVETSPDIAWLRKGLRFDDLLSRLVRLAERKAPVELTRIEKQLLEEWRVELNALYLEERYK